MSQELFYTSAPRGLHPGSQGFCTVAATEGMPPVLMDKLEALSGYRPLFPPSDPKAALNPVVHSHLRISAGHRMWHLLSRISAAGLDYSQRTNKFAHHIVLEDNELPPGGPAWLFQQVGFLETNWDGEVRVLPAGRTPPFGDTTPAICRTWKELTGDAGWAGVLAESFLSDPLRIVYLIFEPGMNVLVLLSEAQSLLSAERRWQVTFCTYFTGLSQGVSCVWRCVPKGSAEAKSASRLQGNVIFDLCTPSGPAQGGQLVEQARTGRILAPPETELERRRDREEKEPPEKIAAFDSRGAIPRRTVLPVSGIERWPDDKPASTPPAPGYTPGPISALPPSVPVRRQFAEENRTSRSRAWFSGFALGMVAGLLLAVGAGTATWYFGDFRLLPNETKTDHSSESDSGTNRAAPASDAGSTPPKTATSEPLPEVPSESSKQVASTPEKNVEAGQTGGQAQASQPGAKPTSEANRRQKDVPKRPPTDAGVRYLALPNWKALAPGQEPKEEKLENLEFELTERCRLHLRGPKEYRYSEERATLKAAGGSNKLSISFQTSNMEEEEVARFWVQDSQLYFRWAENHRQAAPAARDCILNSYLEIENDSSRVHCICRRIIERPPVPIPANPSKYTYEIPWSSESPKLPETMKLFLRSAEVELDGGGPITLKKRSEEDTPHLEWLGGPQSSPKETPKEKKASRPFLKKIQVDIIEPNIVLRWELHEPKQDKGKDIEKDKDKKALAGGPEAPVFLNLKSLVLYAKMGAINFDVLKIGGMKTDRIGPKEAKSKDGEWAILLGDPCPLQ